MTGSVDTPMGVTRRSGYPGEDPGLFLPRVDGPLLSDSDIQRARDAVGLVMSDVDEKSEQMR